MVTLQLYHIVMSRLVWVPTLELDSSEVNQKNLKEDKLGQEKKYCSASS